MYISNICIYYMIYYMFLLWSSAINYSKKKLTPTHAELSDAIGNLLNGVGQHRPRRGSACAWGGGGCDSGLQTSCTSDDVTHPLQNRVGDIICAYIIYIYTYIYKKYHLIQILYIVFVNVVVAFCIAHLLYYTYIYIYSIYPHIYCTAWYVSFICILCVIYIYISYTLCSNITYIIYVWFLLTQCYFL